MNQQEWERSTINCERGVIPKRTCLISWREANDELKSNIKRPHLENCKNCNLGQAVDNQFKKAYADGDTETNRVRCEWCGNKFKPQGIGKHQAACKKKGAVKVTDLEELEDALEDPKEELQRRANAYHDKYADLPSAADLAEGEDVTGIVMFVTKGKEKQAIMEIIEYLLGRL